MKGLAARSDLYGRRTHRLLDANTCLVLLWRHLEKTVVPRLVNAATNKSILSLQNGGLLNRFDKDF